MSIPKFYNINDLLRQAPDGARIVPVSKATLHRMIAAGTFPKPRKLGKRSVWIEEDITLWREQFMEKETELDKVIETMIDYLVCNGLDACLPRQDGDESSDEIVLNAALKLKKLREEEEDG